MLYIYQQKVKTVSKFKIHTGRVRNIQTKRELVAKLDKYGYKHLGLRRFGTKRKWITVHRLVATAFIPNHENKPAIDHINTIKTDNRVENLRWVTNIENSYNPVTLAYFKSETFSNLKKKQQEHLNKAVYCIELDKAFPSIHDACRETGIARNNITRSCERFILGISGVKARNGVPVLHWRWLNE